MRRSLSPPLALVCLLAAAPGHGSGAESQACPVDCYGRPLLGPHGPIDYRWDGAAWTAVENGVPVGPASGPPPALDGAPSRPRRAHSAFTLGPYRATFPGSWPEAVAIGDVTGDGNNDVVLTTTNYSDPLNDYRVFVYPQLAGGILGAPVRYPYGAFATRNGLVLADLNEDRVLDVVVGHDSGISVLLADTLGGLKPPVITVGGDSRALAAMDVDRDGHLDIISLGDSRGASILFGDGRGGFRSSQPLATNASGNNDEEVDDVTADGQRDLVVMSGKVPATPSLSVHRHDGVSGFLPVPDTYFMGSDRLSGGVGLGDVTGDCLADAVVSWPNVPGNLWILAQDGAGGLAAPINVATYHVPEPVEVADLDGDGTEDVVVAHAGWNYVGVYLQDPLAGLDPEALYSIPYAGRYSPQGLALGDFTGDGCADVAIADYNFGLITLEGQGCFTTCSVPPTARAQAFPSDCALLPATLDASASKGCPGTRLRYRWLDSGNPVCDWSPEPRCQVPLLGPTTFTLEVRVADSPSCTASDSVTVSPGSGTLPVAAAGADQRICAGKSAGLDGSGSSGCPGDVLYRWGDGTTVKCDWSSAADCLVTPSASTTYTLDVACDASPTCVASDTVQVAVDTVPLADPGPDQTACEGSTVRLDASLSPPCAGGAGQQFRWLEAGVPACDWAPLPVCFVTPASGVHSFTLEVLCPGSPCVGSKDVGVTLLPVPTAAAGSDVTICAGQSAMLDGSASAGCAAPAQTLFHWLDPVGEACGWSDQPGCSVSPGVTSTYVLEVACSDAPSCIASDPVLVKVIPEIVPADAGNSLRATRSATDVSLSWTIVPPAASYTLYRSTAKDLPFQPLRIGLPTPAALEPDVAGPPDLYLYRAVGASCSGVEGP